MTGPGAVPRRLRPAAVHPRVILLVVLGAIVVACGLYAVAPWILPVGIHEGPMVQLAAPDAVTLEWFTTRPAQCTAQLSGDGVERTVAATVSDSRNVARITGLSPGTSYAYEIRAGRRALTRGLHFETVRPPGEPYSFIVFGDSGKGTRVQYLLGAQMASAQPPADFVLHTGDLIYDGGELWLYEERFFAPYRQLLARVDFWPCLGNHDVDQDDRALAQVTVFELPANGPAGLPAGYNYWFDYSTCRVAVLDSNADEATLHDRVSPWLTKVMADVAPRWRFVVFHHPPYTDGKYMPDERLQRAVVPALEAAGVDVVFSGHDHDYQRTYPLRDGRVVATGQGVVYVVTGAGGAQLYPVRQPLPAFLAAFDDQHFSFTQIAIDGDELHLRQIALGGQVLDETSWRKEVAEPATSPATTAP
jgi:3',5'-cyclic AMP phosphodiesterase CpdA